MKKFQAISAGLFGAHAVNRVLISLHERISALEAQVEGKEAPEGSNPPDTITADSASEGGPPVEPEVASDPIEVFDPELAARQAEEKAEAAKNEPPEFDYETCEDKSALREFAKSKGLTIMGNKKAETIRNEIREFLSKTL